MKVLNFFVALILSVNIIYAQNTEERKISSFNRIKLSCEAKVIVSKGSIENIKIDATGINLADIITSVKDNTLEIELNRGVYVNSNIEIVVYYTDLIEITASSSGSLSFQEPVLTKNLTINANSNSLVHASLNVSTIDVNISQGGTVRLTGNASRINANVITKGILAALDLKADSAFVKVGTAATAKIQAINLLDASIKTGGNLTLLGQPKEKKLKKGIGVTINEVE